MAMRQRGGVKRTFAWQQHIQLVAPNASGSWVALSLEYFIRQ
jgi:hypothetical protein